MGRERTPAVYILASQKRGTLYIGVTSDPLGRIHQHREEVTRGFTSRYGVRRLVYIEFCETMEAAIVRENAAQTLAPAMEDQSHRSGQSRLA